MHGLPPNALVEKHLWIVDRFAAKYQRDAPHADLKSAGALALCEAAQRFKPRKGAAFSTYAWNWVKGHMLKELRRSHVVAVPDHTVRAAARLGETITGVVRFMGPSDDPPVDASQEHGADQSMRRRAVHEAIERLEDRQHRHVINRTLAGRTVEQIAFGMGLTEEQVEGLIEAARENLEWILSG